MAKDPDGLQHIYHEVMRSLLYTSNSKLQLEPALNEHLLQSPGVFHASPHRKMVQLTLAGVRAWPAVVMKTTSGEEGGEEDAFS